MRTLTVAQHDRLDQLAKENPEARVIGWHDQGPVIEFKGLPRRLLPNGETVGPSTRGAGI